MISRFLDWLDESAAGVIRVAYLLAGVIAVASYFSDGRVPSGLALALNAVLPWVLAGALEIHTYLTARRVRRAYQDRRAAALDSDEYERASADMRLNLWILGGLLSFSIYNQLQYLASTWSPPHTPLTPPGPFPYIIRAVVTPAAFMAAAFLAPVGEGMAVQVQAEAHRLATLTFKVARAQWKRQLRDMQQHGVDVTGALVQLVDEPSDRRVIEAIHAAMHPERAAILGTPLAPDSISAGAQPGNGSESFEEATASKPAEPDTQASAEAPTRPPTGPGSPVASKRSQKRETASAPARVVSLPPSRRRTPEPARKVAQAQARTRQRIGAEKRIRALLAEDPRLPFTELVRRAGVSESTASKWVAVIEAERAGQVAR